MKNRSQIYSLLLWIVAIQFLGYLFGGMTKTDIGPWYYNLEKSSLTPPNFVFGIVWPILYCVIAIAGWRIFQGARSEDNRAIRTYYVIQLLLNWSWTPLFFHLQQIHLAFLCILLIILFTVLIIIKAYKKMRLVSWLMLPYLLWLIFASYLNYVIAY